MVDVDQVSAWVVVAAVYVLLPFLLIGPNRPRHAVVVRLQRLGTWALPRLQARSRDDPDDFDPLTDPELMAERRREQAYANLRRLRDLVQTDAAMSATRQIANRIAYDRLRHEVADLEDTVPVRVGPCAPAGPRVVAARETLDVGWPR